VRKNKTSSRVKNTDPSVFVSGTQQIKSIPPLLFHTWKIPPLSAKEIQHRKFRAGIFRITN